MPTFVSPAVVMRWHDNGQETPHVCATLLAPPDWARDLFTALARVNLAADDLLAALARVQSPTP